MSTADKLNKVLETKEAIKQALIDKGQDVGDVFAEYPNAIQSIEGGGRFVVPKDLRFGNSTVKEFPEDWDWSEWKNEGTLSSAFYACNNLIKAPKLSIHPAVVSHMFNGCGSLKSVDMSDWNTESIFAASGLFDGCRSLETLDLSNWDTSSLTQMNEMFDGCSSLKSINFGTFNTDKVTDYASAFYGCNLLRKLPEFNATNWKPSYVSAYNSPLNQCYSLRDFGGFLNLHTTFYANSANSLSYESIMNIINKLADGVSGQTLYLTQDCVNMLSDEDIAIATNKGWTISPARTITEPVVVTALNQIPSTTYQINPRTYDFSQFNGAVGQSNGYGTYDTLLPCRSYLYYFEGDLSSLNDASGMFGNCPNLSGVTITNTHNITKMAYMFCNSSLKNIDMSNWDLSNVTSMSGMFFSTDIKTLDLSDHNTPKLKDLSKFVYGSEIETLDLSVIDTSQVTAISSLAERSKLKHIILGDLPNCEWLSNAFFLCENLESVTMKGAVNPDLWTESYYISGFFESVKPGGTFYYNPAYDYSRLIEQLPSTWTAVPLT